MKPLIFLTFIVFFHLPTYSQSFLDYYKKYRLNKTLTILNAKTRKKIQDYVKLHIVELDTVFKSYKAKTRFDFDSADSLFFIYEAPAESLFTNDIIIWSDKDTISYKQGFEMIKPYKYKRIITYTSFQPAVNSSNGVGVTTERDSLITLVAKRDYNTINHLGDNQSVLDGTYVNIYVAYKDKGRYKIESCSPQQFIIRTIYDKK